jgi:hypothetical protein
LLDSFGFGRFLADVTFSEAPALDLSGTANFSQTAPRLNVIGRITAGKFTYKTVPLVSLAADFSWDGARTMLRDIRVRHESGDLTADLLDAPNDFRFNLESTINPAAVRAIAPADLQNFLGEWEWPRSPAVRFAIRGPSHDAQTWTGEGTVALHRSRFRGVWMNSANADVRFGNGALTFQNLRVTRDEGIGTGAFTYDFAKHEVRLEHVSTTLRPTDAIYWIEPKLYKIVAPYKFHAPPHLTASGVVTFHGRRDTHLEINVDGAAGMDYVFVGKTLAFDHVHGHLLITDDRVQLQGVEGELFGGKVGVAADIITAEHDPRHHALVTVEGVDFPRLTDLYFKFQTARGLMSGTYDFDGVGDNARLMQGTGNIKVANGDVFAIPVFGPLSAFVGAIFPGRGYSIAKQATASFTIRDGIIHTDDFKVSGKAFGMLGHGDIHFLDNKLDFDVRISASGAGAVLTPVYKLFEYKGEGSFTKPNWHPKRF